MLAERLRELRKKENLTQAELAKILYVDQTAVSSWERGKSMPDTTKLQRIASTFGVSIDSLMYDDSNNYNSNISAVKIPVLGRVQAGIPTSAISEILDYEEIPADMAERGEYFGLLVRGDSMSPRILDGDVVIVRCQPDVENGEIAVVAVNGDDATVKKVRKSAMGITLIPLNPAYNTITYTNEQIETLPVEIKGKVVELRRKM